MARLMLAQACSGPNSDAWNARGRILRAADVVGLFLCWVLGRSVAGLPFVGAPWARVSCCSRWLGVAPGLVRWPSPTRPEPVDRGSGIPIVRRPN